MLSCFVNTCFLPGPIEKSSDNVIPMVHHVVGEDALLLCDIINADWYYINIYLAGVGQREIASGGKIVQGSSPKYAIKMSADGSATVGLIVHNASFNDAGIYRCSEKFEQFHRLHLVIKGILDELSHLKLAIYVISLVFHCRDLVHVLVTCWWAGSFYLAIYWQF